MKKFFIKISKIFFFLFGAILTVLGFLALPVTIIFLIAGPVFIYISFKPDTSYYKALKWNKPLNEDEIIEQEQKRKEMIEYYNNLDINDIATKDAPIMLRKNEYSYFISNEMIGWYEVMTKTVRTNYSGITTRTKIMKGVYYSGGSVRHSNRKEKYEDLKIKGTLILTNQRIIVKSPTNVKSTTLSSIDDFNVYNDGIILSRGSGKQIILRGFNPADFAILITKIKETQ